jgi:hypothetical protein
LYLFAHLLVIINESASNTESSAATIAYLEYCERTCRRYYAPWTKTRKLINLSLLSAHDDDSADEIERHRIAGRKDTFVLDLFTSLIVTLYTGMRHRRVGKGAPRNVCGISVNPHHLADILHECHLQFYDSIISLVPDFK